MDRVHAERGQVERWRHSREAFSGEVGEPRGQRRHPADAPQHRGHGHSAPTPTTPTSSGEFLVRALDELGWARVHLVAPDVGVPVALWLATHHPDRLHSLVLSDGPGTWPPTLSRDLGWMVSSRWVRWLLGLGPANFVRTALRRGYVAGAPEHPERFVAAYRDKLHHTLEFIGSYPRELPGLAASASITTPTLVLWGGDDVFVSADNARAIAGILPHARLTVLEGVGHFSHDDDPEAYAAALLPWLAAGRGRHSVA
ncbi:MAG: alpha/beta hydrolase [Myxococcota bacterium]